ncbi:MAG: universal stress protein [Acidobacteria bacterium]|nr:universal stress protein [Acidobacteriota bacterium]
MVAIQTILVPLDFSEASKKAAKYGLTLATQLNARLILAHVAPNMGAMAYIVPPENYSLRREQYEIARRNIQQLIPPELAAGRAIRTIVKIGDVESELLDIVTNEKADLVVMGSHGRKYLGRWFLGSVTEHVLRKIPVPVLTVTHVEADSKAVELGLVVLRRILFATDLSEESRVALRYAIQLARTAGARLTAIHVVDQRDFMYWGGSFEGYMGEMYARVVEDMSLKLKWFVAQDKPDDMEIETVILEGKPYDKILEFSEDRLMDLIVLNLQGKGFVERAVLGSTAERVVRAATVPVLSIPGSAREAKDRVA